MSRQKTAGTISVLLIGLLVLGVCLADMGTRVSAIARLQNATVTPTPCEDDPVDCSDYATEDAVDALTATADEKTAAAEITPSPGTATTTTTMTPGVGTPTVTPALTATATSTNLPTSTRLVPSPIQATPIVEPQRIE